MSLELSVIIPTHNPRRDYLARTLKALRGQTLDHSSWELVVVDNKSEDIGYRISDIVRDRLGKAESGKRKAEKTPSAISDLPSTPSVRVVREEKLGLTHARRRGFRETTGEVVVMADDDNVLSPNLS